MWHRSNRPSRMRFKPSDRARLSFTSPRIAWAGLRHCDCEMVPFATLAGQSSTQTIICWSARGQLVKAHVSRKMPRSRHLIGRPAFSLHVNGRRRSYREDLGVAGGSSVGGGIYSGGNSSRRQLNNINVSARASCGVNPNVGIVVLGAILSGASMCSKVQLNKV